MAEEQPFWTCRNCGSEVTEADLAACGGLCPSCGEGAGPHAPPTETSQWDAVSDVLEGLELDLIRKINTIPHEKTWQAAVVAEMLNHFVGELVDFMDELPNVRTRPRWFTRRKKMTAQIDDSFEGFLMALLGCEDVLRKELGMALAGGELTEIRIFYEQFDDEMHHLQRFYRQTAAFEFPDGSAHRELQMIMLNWGPYIAHQLRDLANRLQTVADLSPEALRDYPVQVSLVPVTLPLFYTVHEKVI